MSDETTIEVEQPMTVRKIPLIGEIDNDLFQAFYACLLTLESESDDPITVVMNSNGGDLYTTLGIYDVLRNSKCKIRIEAYGYCMSGASIILQAADERVMSKHTTMMIHYGTRYFSGNVQEFQSWSKDSDRMSKIIVDIYTKKMKGKNKKQVIHDMLLTDTILSSSDALKLGLIDEIL